MTEETVTNCNALKLVNCGCGGEAIAYIESMDGGFWHRIYVSCAKCGIRTPKFDTEAEAAEAWNRAMGTKSVERTARAIPLELDHDITYGAVTFHKGTNVLCRCSSCGGYVRPKDVYCTLCGCKLEWNEG